MEQQLVSVFLKTALLSAVSVLFTGDSISVSKRLVTELYNSTGVYTTQAAEFGSADANFQLYDETKHLHYLREAARKGHAYASYLLYRELEPKNPNDANVWLEQAANLKNPLALFTVFSSLVERKQWQQARNLLLANKRELAGLSAEKLQIVDDLSERIQIAQNRPLENIQDAQLPAFDINWRARLASESNFETNQGDTCLIRADVLVEKQDYVLPAQEMFSQFKRSELAKIGVCFNQIQYKSQLAAFCYQDDAQRATCELSKLADLWLESDTDGKSAATHLVVLTEAGEANTRGGLMFLDRFDGVEVLQHEVAHWLGYYDEYRLPATVQTQLCHTYGSKPLGHNLVLARRSENVSALELRYGRKLYPAKTCDGTSVIAYKPFKDASFMEFLDLPVSANYSEHIKQHVVATEIVPAAVNFALEFQFDDAAILTSSQKSQQLQRYEYWLTRASLHKFTPAIRMLSQLKQQQRRFDDALILLKYAAGEGDATSQILLGHAYLEGTWLTGDMSESAKWYELAALQSDPYGLYFYGKCLEMGWGCPQSERKAQQYYKQSAELGNTLAKSRLAND